MADTERDIHGTSGGGVDDEAPFRRRALEEICTRRPVITVVFVLSGMMFFASLFLVFGVDISEGSTVIAAVDAVITGTLCVSSAVVLRQCRRLRRGA